MGVVEDAIRKHHSDLLDVGLPVDIGEGVILNYPEGNQKVQEEKYIRLAVHRSV